MKSDAASEMAFSSRRSSSFLRARREAPPKRMGVTMVTRRDMPRDDDGVAVVTAAPRGFRADGFGVTGAVSFVRPIPLPLPSSSSSSSSLSEDSAESSVKDSPPEASLPASPADTPSLSRLDPSKLEESLEHALESSSSDSDPESPSGSIPAESSSFIPNRNNCRTNVLSSDDGSISLDRHRSNPSSTMVRQCRSNSAHVLRERLREENMGRAEDAIDMDPAAPEARKRSSTVVPRPPLGARAALSSPPS
mmetsp:Transcript_56180/g.168175  ORF Transcript_56180/g.168175 Transcript_56180/m.168175 type:complete len:250 (-) Transcript_56180:642-1391(-)